MNTNFKFFKDDKYRLSINPNDKYSLYFSNWMILDLNHIKYFFLNRTLIRKLPTYIKRLGIYKCKFEKDNEGIDIFNRLEENEPNYNKLKHFKIFFTKPYFKDSEQYNGKNIDYCWPIEEIIFGNYILKNILESGKEIDNEL